MSQNKPQNHNTRMGASLRAHPYLSSILSFLRDIYWNKGVVCVSQAATSEKEVPETTVRNRSRYANKLHRQDPDSDEPAPACPLQDVEKEYTEVPTVAYRGHYELCGNPECFGRGWR